MAAINSAPVAYCRSLLEGSGVRVGAAIGFPLGQTPLEAKVFEAQQAIRQGADDIDYVINITALKAKDYPGKEDAAFSSFHTLDNTAY